MSNTPIYRSGQVDSLFYFVVRYDTGRKCVSETKARRATRPEQLHNDQKKDAPKLIALFMVKR